MVGLAFAIAASANFPALLMALFWRGFTTAGAVPSIRVGAVSALVLLGESAAPAPARPAAAPARAR